MKTRRWLAWGAIALGALAALAGSPYGARPSNLDVRGLASAVEHQEDHVTAIDLAQWIKDRKPGLRVIDVRTPAEFDAFHIPTADNIPLESLVTKTFAPSDTLVLYSEGGAHAAQAWVFLRALGYRHVYFLRGGLDDWLDDVMNPTVAANASARVKAGFERVAELSRYFGGVPRVGAPAPAGTESPAVNAADKIARLRRRGC
jgi:rhodanese-related sulfurtransferase